MFGKAKTHKIRLKSLLLAILFTISLLPPIEVHAAGGETHTFTSGAVVLDSYYDGDTVFIYNGVFSVTVVGATDLSIRFVDVTIDRRHDPNTNDSDPLNGTTVPNLYDAAQKLGWGNKAPVCPFLITGNSSVTAGFTGECTFYAGTNGCTVDSSNTYTASRTGGGFAAIQVDAGSSLTITDAEKLTVYGAHQLGSPEYKVLEEGKPPVLAITHNGVTASYEFVLRANVDIPDANYNDPYDDQWNACQTHSQFTASGGAGIGGGVTYNTNTGNNSQGSASPSYTQGTPGTIIINGGNIEAFGGYAAAGIGGGVNGAATKSTITINGGNVTAHGGRFAAGIGDGDSVPVNNGNTQGPSPDFRDATGRIEINGGTVTAYGGVASAGIGCTDDMNSTQGFNGATSKLEIAINGGAVNAFSGFPDGFAGSYRDNVDAPAAIGAGAKSQMESNSIYISSAADLLCAAFGNYSLTEIGTNSEAAPTINVDSDGYLLLLRTGDYYAKEERPLKLWKPLTAEVPGVGTCVIYTVQSTGELYYCCYDEEGNRLIYQMNGNTVTKVEDSVAGLTLYVNEDPAKGPVSEPLTDENGKQLKIDLYDFFRSMAITLPEPEKHGGLYAITVPMDGVSSNQKPINGADIFLTVEAYEQGTQSGTITYPSDHNLNLDKTAERLTDLDVYTDEDTYLDTDGLIGKTFKPGVFAYTVYVEPDVDEVTLRAAFAVATGTSYNLTLDGNQLDPTGQGATREVSSNVNLTGVTSKTVRLKKVDGGDTFGAITYKVTIIKKSQYKLLINEPGKIYDGTPVQVSITSVGYSDTAYVPVDVPGTAPADIAVNAEESTTTIDDITVRVRNNYRAAAISMQLDVVPISNSVVNYILTLNLSQSGTQRNTLTIERSKTVVGWQVDYTTSKTTYLTARPTNPANVTANDWIANAGTTRIAYANNSSNYPLQVVTTADGSVNLKASSTSTDIQIFSIGNVTSQESLFVNDRTAQKTAATQAIKAGATERSFPYANYIGSETIQNLTVQTITAGTNNNTANGKSSIPVTIQSIKDYDDDGAGTWEIRKETQFFAVSVPEEDFEQVSLVFYQTHKADGTPMEKTPLEKGIIPTDVGTYSVEAEIRTTTYNASGSKSFTIQRREVRVQQITNWLLYVKTPPTESTLAITEPGAIVLENVVSGDDVSLSVDAANGKVYYNETGLNYAPDKITLQDATLVGERAFNYRLHYDDGARVRIFVFGQIALDVQGSTFRKTAEGSWRKYYPQSDGDPVGTANNPADYHSPAIDGVYRAHSEYVRARTVNHNSGTRYAVDIEYGAMQFGYYRGVWDVNTLSVVETAESFWAGMDGQNNRIILTNYSNAEVYYKVSAKIKSFYAEIDEVRGIRAKITPDADGKEGMATWTSVAAATPGDSVNNGSSGSGECFLFLSGVPQMQESSTYIEIGTITVTLSPTGGS